MVPSIRTSPKSKTARASTSPRSLAEVAKRAKARALATRRARGEALLALVERRKQRIVEDFYDIGLALRELRDDKLYEALGHPSFEALLDAHALMSSSSAKKLIAVVEHVSREQALRLGREKAYALVAYAAATPEADVPEELAARDAEIAGKKVSALSTRELEAAASDARRRAKPPTPKERAAEKARRAAVASLRRFAKRTRLGALEIAVRGNRILVALTLEQVELLTR
jgi:hypothetical protein